MICFVFRLGFRLVIFVKSCWYNGPPPPTSSWRVLAVRRDFSSSSPPSLSCLCNSAISLRFFSLYMSICSCSSWVELWDASTISYIYKTERDTENPVGQREKKNLPILQTFIVSVTPITLVNQLRLCSSVKSKACTESNLLINSLRLLHD